MHEKEFFQLFMLSYFRSWVFASACGFFSQSGFTS